MSSPRLTPPQIVVLDGYTLNPGDQSWAPLAALGELQVFERTTRDELGARASEAEIVLTNKFVLDAPALAELPALRYIGVTATGTNVVDRAAAAARGIVVTNVPSYGADSVAEHTLGLMLEASKHMGDHLRAVRDGAWSRQPDFSFTTASIGLLAGKTLGIIGFGAIGRRVAELAACFKMRVLVARHRAQTSSATQPPGVSHEGLDELLAQADILTLHCPLTPATEGLVNRERLGRMKPSAVLINTARGGLIDEAALADALNGGRLRAAYLDVLSREPPAPDHVLLRTPTCHVTPHIAWASLEARQRLLDEAIENVRAFLAGAARNRV
jgi:glycerate dehydrogenase